MFVQTNRNRIKIVAAVLALFMIMLLVPAGDALRSRAATEGLQLNLASDTILGNEEIVFTLTNDSGENIVLTNPADRPVAVEVKATGAFLNHDFNLGWGINPLDADLGDVIFGGASSLEIADGDTAEVARIAPGLPDTWRQFANADHEMEISLRVVINGDDTHFEPLTVTVEPVDLNLDLVLSVSEMQYDDEGIEGDFVLSLTNNTGSAVVINGPAVIQAENDWTTNPGWERDGYDLIGGESMTVAVGTTIDIVLVEGGPSTSWRAFYYPQIRKITAWLQIEGEGLWQSEQVSFAIVGGLQDEPAIHGSIVSITDMEDGTAKITVTAEKAVFTDRVYHDGTEYVQESSYEVLDEMMTGLFRQYFNATRYLPGGGQEFVGDIISVRETAPGTYEIVWAADDGTHNIILEYYNPDIHGHTAMFDEGVMGHPEIEVTISTLNRPIEMTQNQDTGKYEGTLTYPAARITFIGDEPVTAEINYRQKGSTDRPLPPAGINPAGLFFDINLAGGDLGGVEILLEIDYSRGDIPAGMSEKDLRIFRYNETTEEWDLLPNQEIDTENQVIRVWLDGFSEFGVFENASDEDESEDEDEEPIPVTGSGSSSLLVAMLAIMAGIIALLIRKPVKTN